MRAPKRPVSVTQGPSPIPGNSGDGRLHPTVPAARENYNGRLTSESFANPAGPRRPRGNRTFAQRHGG
jgi:hypothetical protein